MSDDIRYEIEGEEPERAERAPSSSSLTENQQRTREAIGRTNYWRNEKLALDRQAAETKLHNIDAQTENVSNEARRALEEGRFDDHSAATARIADLRVQRVQAENERNHYARQPVLPTDPVVTISRAVRSQPLRGCARIRASPWQLARITIRNAVGSWMPPTRTRWKKGTPSILTAIFASLRKSSAWLNSAVGAAALAAVK
jgi:hypothetical protein